MKAKLRIRTITGVRKLAERELLTGLAGGILGAITAAVGVIWSIAYLVLFMSPLIYV